MEAQRQPLHVLEEHSSQVDCHPLSEEVCEIRLAVGEEPLRQVDRDYCERSQIEVSEDVCGRRPGFEALRTPLYDVEQLSQFLRHDERSGCDYRDTGHKEDDMGPGCTRSLRTLLEVLTVLTPF